MSYWVVLFALREVFEGNATVDFVLKLLLETPPSIVPPLPDTTDNVPVTANPVIVDQLSGGILKNLNPVIVIVSVTTRRLIADMLVLTNTYVVACLTPPTIYCSKFEYKIVVCDDGVMVGVIDGVGVGLNDGVMVGVGVIVGVIGGVGSINDAEPTTNLELTNVVLFTINAILYYLNPTK